MDTQAIGRKVMVLTQDVVNPFADRRNKYTWHRQAFFPKGMHFVVNTFDLGERFNYEETKGKMCREIRKAASQAEPVLDLPQYAPLWQALDPYLVEAPLTVKSILEDAGEDAREHTTHSQILHKLVEKGVLTVEQVKELMNEICKEG